MTITIQLVSGVQSPPAYLTGFKCYLTPSRCYPSKRLVYMKSGVKVAWKLSKREPRQDVLTPEVTWSCVETLALTQLSELKCWHQSPRFRCLLCLQPNLGRVPVPPIISYLAAMRWQSQLRGVGAAVLCFWVCAAGEHCCKIPASRHLAEGEVAPRELKGMTCKWEEGVLFSAKHSESSWWLWAHFTKAFWDTGVHH